LFFLHRFLKHRIQTEQVLSTGAIAGPYENYTCQLLENLVPRCDN
jgi:hypothetical protein